MSVIPDAPPGSRTRLSMREFTPYERRSRDWRIIAAMAHLFFPTGFGVGFIGGVAIAACFCQAASRFMAACSFYASVVVVCAMMAAARSK